MGLDVRRRSAEEEERLIRDNMGLAFYQLKKWGRLADDDAKSAALEGLWKAARTFDDSKGAKFSTYASICIYNAIGMHMRKLKQAKDNEVTSLDKTLCEDVVVTLADTIADEHTPESVYLASEAITEMHKAYDRLLAKTSSDKQKRVLELWFGSYGRITQREIAQATGMTQSYVSRIIGTIKHKFRKELEEYV